jgi:hypothetical protein
MRRKLFGLFVIGLVLTVTGWMFDRALDIKEFAKIALPGYIYGNELLNALEQDPTLAAVPSNPGFRPIIAWWPQLEDKGAVQTISRSPAFIDFGSSVTNDILLIPKDGDAKQRGPSWRMSLARRQLAERARARLFWMGAVIFFVGVIVSATSGTLPVR